MLRSCDWRRNKRIRGPVFRSDMTVMRRVEELMDRVRSEYLEMPGMILQLDQIARLCGVDRVLCRTVLDRLVEAGFLRMRIDGGYVRA